MAISRSASYGARGFKQVSKEQAATVRDNSRTHDIHGKPFPFMTPAHQKMGAARVGFIKQAQARGYRGATMKHLSAFAKATGMKPPRAARFDKAAGYDTGYRRDERGMFTKG